MTPSRLPLPAWTRAGAVNIGLDFGTHSTKVMLRVRGGHRGLVICADQPARGYPPYAAPSLVRLSRGRLFFGRQAGESIGGHLFRSLKMSLLPPDRSGWPPGEFPDDTTPDLLVALYLSWVLGRVKAVLGDVREERVSLNVAAPMSSVENAALKERYLLVVHAAWQAVFGKAATPIEQGAEWAAARAAFVRLLERKVPALSDRRFDVLPETLAPLVSLCMDPRVAPGLYLAIDMGAGTTELSVSYLPRYSSNAADRRITFYSDRSTRLGGDMFEANDRRHAGEPAARALGDEALRESLRTEMRMVWYEGFQKFMRGGCKRRSRSAAPAGREAWRSVPSDLSRAAPPSRPELGPLLLR